MKFKKCKTEKTKEMPNKKEGDLSLGDKIYLIYHFMLGFVVFVYVEDKYKYEYTKNIKEIAGEIGIIWIIISGITLVAYLLIKKIIKKLIARRN